MAKAKTYNQEGKELIAVDLNEAVFAVKPKMSLIHQVYVALRANEREPWADTKGKGEVRGGGKKPWKQKGTGRARHGSIRSPIWKGGGVVFGPRTVRNFKQKINKKMGQEAVRMCLTDKLADGKLFIIESLDFNGKTKAVSELLKNLSINQKTLLLVDKMDESLKKAVKNISFLSLKKASDVNVTDLLNNKTVLISKEAVTNLGKRLAK